MHRCTHAHAHTHACTHTHITWFLISIRYFVLYTMHSWWDFTYREVRYTLLQYLLLIVIPWACVVCLIYTPEARGCIYQVNHKCTRYNYYVPLPCTIVHGRALSTANLCINEVTLFIVSLIAFDFGFKV